MPQSSSRTRSRPTEQIVVEKPLSVEKSVCGTASLTLSEQQHSYHMMLGDQPLDQRNADDGESLDFLDEMINETSARWKESIQSITTTTMMQNSWTSLSSNSNALPSTPEDGFTGRGSSQRSSSATTPRPPTRRARTTTAPVSHVNVPAGFSHTPDDDITMDGFHEHPTRR